MSDNDTLTLGKLKAMARLLKAIPPPPFLASSKVLPADKALTFTFEGRQYVGAHPDFWEKVPKGTLETGNQFSALRVVNLDFDLSAKAKFYEAMAGSNNRRISGQTATTETIPLPRASDAQV